MIMVSIYWVPAYWSPKCSACIYNLIFYLYNLIFYLSTSLQLQIIMKFCFKKWGMETSLVAQAVKNEEWKDKVLAFTSTVFPFRFMMGS